VTVADHSDWTLDLASGYRGSVSTAGWRLVADAPGAPRFAREEAAATMIGEGSASRVQPASVPDDINWDDRFASPGLNGGAYTLAVDGNGNLYAGGEFTTAGGVSARHVARWDGTWSALGSGLNNTVLDLAVYGENLYVGGTFVTAGAKDSGFIGIWHRPLLSPVPSEENPSPRAVLRHAAPNPFNPRTTLAFELPAPAWVRMAIYDVRGRLVRVLVDESLTSGSHVATWDGRDRRGGDVASGTYFARIDAGAVHEAVAITLAR
jgi:hypothetical protein